MTEKSIQAELRRLTEQTRRLREELRAFVRQPDRMRLPHEGDHIPGSDEPVANE